jgi:hypothetical protein
MQAIEVETTVKPNITIHVPEEYRPWYGKKCRVLVLVAEDKDDHEASIDLMAYSGTVDWPVDGIEYQRQVRSEWE